METDNHLEQGIIYLNAGRMDEAEECFCQVSVDVPGYADALHGQALVARMRGDLDRALDFVAQALTISPDSASCLNSMGDILRMRGDLAAAEEALTRALQIAPEFSLAYNNLGMVYLSQGDFSKAVMAFTQAVQLDPTLFMAHFNIGLAFKELNRLEASIAAYRRAIAIKADFVEAHVNLAIVLLLDGQLREGFEEYEWRLMPNFTPPREFASPCWDGMVDPNATLLVHTEQGFGDIIQFIRYLPFIAAEGMRIIVQCPAELQSLLQGVEGISMVYGFDEALPDFDFHIPLLSLPHLFQTDLSRIPANVPYLFTAFEKTQAWRDQLFALGETLKIGLRWSGNPRNTHDGGRSCPLSLFEPLAGMSQVTFVSLQNEPLSELDRASAEKLGLVDVSSGLHDFTDTAALIANLDLVISVDTAVLHLAGALGRPTWALLKYAPHWPWLVGREDSPWYPSLFLFRQSEAGDWAKVLEEVAMVLDGAIQSIQE